VAVHPSISEHAHFKVYFKLFKAASVKRIAKNNEHFKHEGFVMTMSTAINQLLQLNAVTRM
jgi:hypothetical protein